VLVVAALGNPHLDLSALGDAAVALAGVGIYAFIAAGIGALGTDPQAAEAQRKVSPGASYLFMLLASLFAYAIYNPSLWGRVVQLILSGVLAFALWQTLRDRLPYLLDPVDRPPPRIGFADGMYAVLAFFVIQGVVMVMMMSAQAPTGVAMAVAFVLAGLLASGGMLLSLWRRGVPDLLRTIGLRRQRSDWRGGLIVGFVMGLGAGVVAAGFALLYLRVVELVPGLRELRDQAALIPVDADVVLWFAILAVVAAPICEEIIFRGLVFRGLRRSLPLGWAACASAAIFACVHAPLSAVPVFAMGLLAALVFELSGWLVAPMVAHFTYNLAMVVFQLG
jgi:ABC-2 type transport system permease protein